MSSSAATCVGRAVRHVAQQRIAPAPPPPIDAGWAAAARRLFFSSPASTAATVVLGAALLALGWQLVLWGMVHAVFSTGGAGPEACRREGAGACWAVIGEKHRLILFGIYPYAQQWRPAAAMAVLVAMYVVSACRACGTGASSRGGRRARYLRRADVGRGLRLPFVPDDQWGGLPVTLILATLGLAAGFPLAIALALLRHSDSDGTARRSRWPTSRSCAACRCWRCCSSRA